ncbi:MAG: hypothetical protein LUI87_12550, partial [Lachnospiraceae bacterium]|nr:hypothetical protein [Lachnospiraceae bacterium]
CRGALKDNKKELRIVEDTFKLFCQMEPSARKRDISREDHRDKTKEKREDAKYGTETGKSKKIRSGAAGRKTTGTGIGKDTE